MLRRLLIDEIIILSRVLVTEEELNKLNDVALLHKYRELVTVETIEMVKSFEKR